MDDEGGLLSQLEFNVNISWVLFDMFFICFYIILLMTRLTFIIIVFFSLLIFFEKTNMYINDQKQTKQDAKLEGT